MRAGAVRRRWLEEVTVGGVSGRKWVPLRKPLHTESSGAPRPMWSENKHHKTRYKITLTSCDSCPRRRPQRRVLAHTRSSNAPSSSSSWTCSSCSHPLFPNPKKRTKHPTSSPSSPPLSPQTRGACGSSSAPAGTTCRAAASAAAPSAPKIRPCARTKLASSR